MSVLIISHAEDVHTREVLLHLRRHGTPAAILDTAHLPTRGALTITHGPEQGWAAWARLPGDAFDLAKVRAAWWRRPQPFTLDDSVGRAEDRHFAAMETQSALSGLWSLLDAEWINDPDRDERAGRKAFQLKVARQQGLRVPRTCITNDPDAARAFIAAEERQVIYKAFSATERTWRETRMLRAEEEAGLDAVRFAPVIFQEYIPAAVDLRVTAVGGRLFAAEIHSQQTVYAYDFRVAMHEADIKPHRLPERIERELRGLMRELGLVYGAIDLRLTPDNEYVFLEINPAGQWLFVEQRTGQPISAAIADTLTEMARRDEAEGQRDRRDRLGGRPAGLALAEVA